LQIHPLFDQCTPIGNVLRDLIASNAPTPPGKKEPELMKRLNWPAPSTGGDEKGRSFDIPLASIGFCRYPSSTQIWQKH
jgi:hypothetical protein